MAEEKPKPFWTPEKKRIAYFSLLVATIIFVVGNIGIFLVGLSAPEMQPVIWIMITAVITLLIKDFANVLDKPNEEITKRLDKIIELLDKK